MARRRSLSETRTLLLEAGATLLAEHGVPVTLDRITLIDVSRRAGLTTAGSAYKIWPNQDAYRAELLEHLVPRSTASFPTRAQVEGLFGPDGPGIPFDELLRLAATATDTEAQRGLYPMYLLVWLARFTDEAVAGAFADSEAAWFDELTAMVAQVMDAFDREFVPPFDLDVLTLTIAAFAEGLAIRGRATPDLVPEALDLPTGTDGSDQPWPPLAIGFKALFDAYTRPRG